MSVIDLEEAVKFWEMKNRILNFLRCCLSEGIYPCEWDDKLYFLAKQIESLGKKEDK